MKNEANTLEDQAYKAQMERLKTATEQEGYDAYVEDVEKAMNWYIAAFHKPPKDRNIYERYCVSIVEQEFAVKVENLYKLGLLTNHITSLKNQEDGQKNVQPVRQKKKPKTQEKK